jgi:hypothetical protein
MLFGEQRTVFIPSELERFPCSMQIVKTFIFGISCTNDDVADIFA